MCPFGTLVSPPFLGWQGTTGIRTSSVTASRIHPGVVVQVQANHLDPRMKGWCYPVTLTVEMEMCLIQMHIMCIYIYIWKYIHIYIYYIYISINMYILYMYVYIYIRIFIGLYTKPTGFNSKPGNDEMKIQNLSASIVGGLKIWSGHHYYIPGN